MGAPSAAFDVPTMRAMRASAASPSEKGPRPALTVAGATWMPIVKGISGSFGGVIEVRVIAWTRV